MGGLLVASAQKSRLESDHLVGILLWCCNRANNHTTKPLRPPTITCETHETPCLNPSDVTLAKE